MEAYSVISDGYAPKPLIFADNLLLIPDASSEQVYFINSILEEFCLCFGAKVNKSKT